MQAVTTRVSRNSLKLMAQSSKALLKEVDRTQKAYQEYIEEAEKVNQEQTDRIALLEKRILQLEGANHDLQVVNQSIQGKLNSAIDEKSALLAKIAYLERGLAAVNAECADHKNMRSEYYDIIGGLLYRRGFSHDAALHKCRRFNL